MLCYNVNDMDKPVTNFEIIKSDSKEDVFSGHGTSVRVFKSLTGDVVEKNVSNVGMFAKSPDVWLKNQTKSKKISDRLREKNNPAYNVPKTFVAHGKVREDFVYGQLLRNVPKDLLQENKSWTYRAISEFINDMSELEPVQHTKILTQSVGNLPVKNLGDFLYLLDSRGKNVLKEEVKRFLGDCFVFLRNLPENQIFVFGHNDLHPDNIIVDMANKKLSIIDFEMAGYRTQFSAMYNQFRSPEIWRMVNALPRTKNSNLKWHYDSKISELYVYLRWVVAEVNNERDVKRLAKKINDSFKKGCFLYADARANYKKREQGGVSVALVPVSHYEKD